MRLESLRHLFYASPLYGLTLRGPVPDRLRGTPPDPWPGSPEEGKAILRGDFVLADRKVALGDEPWDRALPSAAAEIALHGFEWLADLRAVGSAAARARARALIGGWIGRHGEWALPAWAPEIVARRLTAWFTAWSFVDGDDEAGGGEGGDGEGDGFRATFLASVAAQVRHLGRVVPSMAHDARLLIALKGLVYAGVCVPGREDVLESGLRLLGQEVDSQVLPDGGHVARNPAVQVEVLGHLLDVRETLSAAQIEVPTALQNAVDRMAPMLRALRLGDGGLAQFNGATEDDPAVVDAVLAQSGSKGRPLLNAVHSGFQRLAAGRVIAVVDAGPPPRDGVGAHAHAGTLSFEMSIGRERLVVNCGGYGGEDAAWRQAVRATAAHSTLSVDDTNSAEILADGRLGRRPVMVTSARREAEGHVWLETQHDGYRSSHGLIHRRRLYLEASGEDLRGEDGLEGVGGRSFAIRFHLHPSVDASPVSDGSGVLLRLEKGGGWRFRASGGAIRLEEGVYVGSGEARRNEQIVVSGPLNGHGALVKWRFNRIPT